MLTNRIYYNLKPFIPRMIQILLRRLRVAYKRKKYAHIWPIDPDAGTPPEGWTGWPDGKKFALVLTHDVDTQKGHDRCCKLMDVEEKLGFRSSYNFVSERYNVSTQLIKDTINRGFEVGVHGVKHDGKLFATKEIFQERAKVINRYLKDWGAVGFRSPAMHHNLNWIHDLNIEYDASTFDTDPFEPQSDGVKQIFPFWVQNKHSNHGYVELPYTLVQDFTLFILLRMKTIEIWEKKFDWIAERGGMVLVNVHPDYINFDNSNCAPEEYPVSYYLKLLEYASRKYQGQYINFLPCEVAEYYKKSVFNF
ncbi:MAG: hypothetical protein ACQ9MH_15960 [Nitrospinales bacterium]